MSVDWCESTTSKYIIRLNKALNFVYDICYRQIRKYYFREEIMILFLSIYIFMSLLLDYFDSSWNGTPKVSLIRTVKYCYTTTRHTAHINEYLKLNWYYFVIVHSFHVLSLLKLLSFLIKTSSHLLILFNLIEYSSLTSYITAYLLIYVRGNSCASQSGLTTLQLALIRFCFVVYNIL